MLEICNMHCVFMNYFQTIIFLLMCLGLSFSEICKYLLHLYNKIHMQVCSSEMLQNIRQNFVVIRTRNNYKFHSCIGNGKFLLRNTKVPFHNFLSSRLSNNFTTKCGLRNRRSGQFWFKISSHIQVSKCLTLLSDEMF